MDCFQFPVEMDWKSLRSLGLITLQICTHALKQDGSIGLDPIQTSVMEPRHQVLVSARQAESPGVQPVSTRSRHSDEQSADAFSVLIKRLQCTRGQKMMNNDT